jgi:hypothetical protein
VEKSEGLEPSIFRAVPTSMVLGLGDILANVRCPLNHILSPQTNQLIIWRVLAVVKINGSLNFDYKINF